MQRRMTKSSKVIAYIVGIFVLAGSGFETIGQIYVLAGMAWLAVWLFGLFQRSAEWTVGHQAGKNPILDEPSKPEPFGRDYGTLSANDATVIYNSGHN